MGRSELKSELEQLMRQQDVGPTELARRTGIERSHIYRILKCEVDPSMDTLRALARGLRVHNSHLIGRMYSDYLRPLNREGRAEKHRDYDSAFVRDVTYGDNAVVATNQVFVKVWAIQNVGKVPWIGCRLVDVSDSRAPGYLRPSSGVIELPTVMPGETIQIEMQFKAPHGAGTVVSRWRMQDADGEFIFPEKDGIWCQVVVEDV